MVSPMANPNNIPSFAIKNKSENILHSQKRTLFWRNCLDLPLMRAMDEFGHTQPLHNAQMAKHSSDTNGITIILPMLRYTGAPRSYTPQNKRNQPRTIPPWHAKLPSHTLWHITSQESQQRWLVLPMVLLTAAMPLSLLTNCDICFMPSFYVQSFIIFCSIFFLRFLRFFVIFVFFLLFFTCFCVFFHRSYSFWSFYEKLKD